MRSHHTAKVLTRINNDIHWTFQVRVQWTPPKKVGHWLGDGKKGRASFYPLVAGSSPAALTSPTNGRKTDIIREQTRRKAGLLLSSPHFTLRSQAALLIKIFSVHGLVFLESIGLVKMTKPLVAEINKPSSGSRPVDRRSQEVFPRPGSAASKVSPPDQNGSPVKVPKNAYGVGLVRDPALGIPPSYKNRWWGGSQGSHIACPKSQPIWAF